MNRGPFLGGRFVCVAWCAHTPRTNAGISLALAEMLTKVPAALALVPLDGRDAHSEGHLIGALRGVHGSRGHLRCVLAHLHLWEKWGWREKKELCFCVFELNWGHMATVGVRHLGRDWKHISTLLVMKKKRSSSTPFTPPLSPPPSWLTPSLTPPSHHLLSSALSEASSTWMIALASSEAPTAFSFRACSRHLFTSSRSVRTSAHTSPSTAGHSPVGQAAWEREREREKRHIEGKVGCAIWGE